MTAAEVVTPEGHNKGKCSCGQCRSYRRVYNAERKVARYAQRVEIDGRMVATHRPPDSHGKWNTYNRYGCQCAPCTDAAYGHVTRSKLARTDRDPMESNADLAHMVDEYQHMRSFGRGHEWACERLGVNPDTFKSRLAGNGLAHITHEQRRAA